MNRSPAIGAAVLFALLTLASAPGTSAQEDAPAVEAPPADAAAAAPPARIGLIDMAYVFKHYRKFGVLQEAIRTEFAEEDLKAKRMASEADLLANQLQKLPEGSDERAAIEQQLIKRKAEFESFRKTAQREILKQESQLYRTIYLEVSDAIRDHARAEGFRTILRFSREDIDATSDPKEILQVLNRAVPYYDPEDDITDAIVEVLNENYDQESR